MLITIGAVVLAFGVLGNVARAVTALGERSRAETSMRVGECINQMAYSKRSFSSTSSSDCGDPANTYVLAAKGDASGYLAEVTGCTCSSQASMAAGTVNTMPVSGGLTRRSV